MTPKIKVIDSHTGGEPTRIVVEGGPDLGDGPLAERVERFRSEFDSIRSAVVNEPRGSDVLVGGLLCQPTDKSFSAGVIYFNNAGYLGMCGHGTIGLMVTLKYLGLVDDGEHEIETPVGPIRTRLEPGGKVSVRNVRSFRLHQDISIDVPDYGTVVGDVAWGGNWFFLVKNSTEKLVVENTAYLTQVTHRIRETLSSEGVTGTDGAMVDHVELFGPPEDVTNDSRNFVLCPGSAYDRSPCGTGTSAKLACLAADGVLAPATIWKQESVVGSVFECSYETAEGETAEGETGEGETGVIPTIRGTAHICSDATLILDPDDPLCMGIRP